MESEKTPTFTPSPLPLAENSIDRAVVLDSGHVKASFVDSTILVLEPQGRSFSVMLPVSLSKAKARSSAAAASSTLESREEDKEDKEKEKEVWLFVVLYVCV